MSNAYVTSNNVANCIYPTVQCLTLKGAKLPVRAHPTDAGADMFAYLGEEFINMYLEILPGEQKLVETGIGMKIPVGYAGFVGPRSSQRVKAVTCWGDGIIDSDYRGTIKVVLANNGKEPYIVNHGDKIAQIVIKRVELVGFVDAWNDTERGTGGFGSTGR